MAAAHQVAFGKVISVVRGVAFALLASAASAAGAAPLQPTDKWVLDYENAQCNAYRNYGSDKDPLYLAFKAPPVGSVIQMMVLQRGPRSQASQQEATVRVGSGDRLKTTMLVYRTGQGKYRTKLMNIPLKDFDGLIGSPSIEIVSAGSDYSFAVKDFAPLKKALGECLSDLRGYWNVPEPGKPEPRLSQDASGDLAALFASEDYPWMAVRGQMEGHTAVALLIDERGKVADCSVIETSGVASIDAQSCAVIRDRAKFNPALGIDGKAARSAWLQRITWRLEGRKRPPSNVAGGWSTNRADDPAN